MQAGIFGCCLSQEKKDAFARHAIAQDRLSGEIDIVDLVQGTRIITFLS